MRLDIDLSPGTEGMVAGIAAALAFGQQRLKATIKELSPEQLTAVPAGLTNSIATLVNHVAGVEANLAHRLMGQTTPEELKAEYLLNLPQSPLPVAVGETVESLTEKMDRARSLLSGALANLSDADPTREIAMSGDRVATLRWLLALLPVHQAMHLGHIQFIKRLNG